MGFRGRRQVMASAAAFLVVGSCIHRAIPSMMKTRNVLLASSALLLALSLAVRFIPGATHKVQTAPGTSAASTAARELTNSIALLARSDATNRAVRVAAQQVTALPKNSDAWVHLGDALTTQARVALDASLYKRIEQVYLRAHELDSSDTDALVGLAWASGAAHRFDDSVAWAMLAIKADPDRAPAYGILGDAAVELGRYEEASRHYQKMLDLHPDLSAYSRAAHLLYLEGNVPRSMSMIRKAIEAAGGEPERAAWCVAELSSMLCREGAAPLAVKLTDEWLKRAPENLTLLMASGLAQMAAKHPSEAIVALEKSVAKTPQHVALAALHDLYLAAGRKAEADTTTARIEALHHEYQVQQIQGGEGQLARFYADNGLKLDEAVHLAETEYAHHRGAVAADTLAWTYFKAGRIQDAAKLIPEITKHRVPDAAMLYHVGLIEEARGDITSARRHLYAALSRQPDFNPVHAAIAQAKLQRLGSIGTEVAVNQPSP